MLFLLHHPKHRDQRRAHRYQRRARYGPLAEPVPQYQPGEEGVEYERDGAEWREDDDGQGIELENGGEYVGGDVDAKAE